MPIECVYWIVAVIFSTFYGIRGIMYCMHYVGIENAKIQKEYETDKLAWTLSQRIVVHYIQDFIYNFVCSLFGFIALYWDLKIARSISDFSNIAGGTAAVITFLSLVGIIGVSGALPRILFRKGF